VTDAERHLMTIFTGALERDSEPERAAYLDEACGGDADLRGRVDALLRAHEQAGGFLEPGVTAGSETSSVAAAPANPVAGGIVAGRYKLIEEIGEGGMGTVWMAQQTEPVKRAVALKLIKPGMDSRQVLARFEAERQALALMDHPNIARVLDAGAIESGRPFFVMELVKGVPITKYCDEHRLTPRQRLELFVPVCQAVQHAHQKGIIHRDIKPSNILVAQYDGRPVPKVIDFGVAKAAGQQLTDKTLMTGFGAVVGTLEYMSPEQAELNQLDIDTRSDIYSLGVVLYELLTGSTPLDRKRLKQAAFAEVLRIIREEEPPKPSTRLSGSKDSLPSVSAQRQMEPAKLTKLVRGELDWIVMKALDKDRDRRYETANGFAMDVQRYLADEPVLACPPSAGYRLRKLLRRHKGPVLAGSAIVLVLAVLTGSIGWVARDAAARRAETERVVTSALEESASWQAQRRLPEAASAARRADGLLAGVDAAEALRQRVRARLADLELLNRLENVRLEKMTAGFDRQGADRLYGQTFRDAGLDVEALPAEEAGQRIQQSTLATELAAVLDSWALLRRLNRGVEDSSWKDLLRIARVADPDVWRTRVREALERSDRPALRALASSPEVFDLAPPTLFVLGYALNGDKEWHTQVEVFLRKAQRRHPNDFWLNNNLMEFLDATQPPQPEEALRFTTVAAALRPDSAAARNNLGFALAGKGLLDEAIAEYREAIRLDKDYALAHLNLGNALHDKGHLDDALAELRAAIQIRPDYPEAHVNVGNILVKKKQFDDAIAAYRKAIGTKQRFPEAYKAHNGLGDALMGKRQPKEAVAEYQAAIHLNNNFAEAHYGLGNAFFPHRLEEAITEYGEAIRINPNYAEAHTNLGNCFGVKGDLDRAIRAYRSALGINKDLFEAHLNFGTALWLKDQLDEALTELQKAILLKKDHSGAHDQLGLVWQAKGRLKDAQAEYREAIRLEKSNGAAKEHLRQAEQLSRLEKRMPAISADKDHPKDAMECLAVAQLCQPPYRKHYAAAARFFAKAFALEPKLAEELRVPYRYDAACAAALAGRGEADDAVKLNATERARLRRQALDWLRADLDAKRLLLEKDPNKAGPPLLREMRHWLADPDFAGVRGPAISNLPETERQPWQQLWNDVADVLKRAQEKTGSGKK
jgi:serine/threonine protein kinase/tetratricopeptide (TPR) repeat protein